ncbi:MAG: rhomboid family intramembrane serine protease [Pseudomonadota bacterium]
MHHPDHDAPPFNPVPAIVLVPALAILAVEVAVQAGASGFVGGPAAIGWRLSLVQSFGFFDALWEQMLATGYTGQGALWRPVTYVFFHFSFVDALFAAVILLAIGNRVARVFSAFAIGVVFLASAAVGAAVFGLVRDTDQPLVGAWPVVYAFVGLLTWTLWITARRTGDDPAVAFQLVGMLVALQLFFWVAFGASTNLAADLSGFLTAFLLAPVLVPGGIGHVRQLLRAR